MDVSGLYDGLAEVGYGYGPVFQGLQAAWRVGGDVFAEVALAEDDHAAAARFGLHPALLDAALHALGLVEGTGRGGVGLPFSWSGVSCTRPAPPRCGSGCRRPGRTRSR
ncbi:polyketide synthase dehydratase domain-containing protein [Kitasatospora aburaviensis]